VGPAILEGNAAAVFMHEVLGHRLEGHRQKDEKEGQTFRAMVGEKIMPDFLNVIFDPGIKRYKGFPLAGHYKYDEQGVPGQKVVAIEQGILKSFLMSRTPIEDFPTSNGHARAQVGMLPISRQSNLIVETSNPLPASDLRKNLIKECIKQNKPYGLLFKRVEGGFTMTGRTTPNAFNVMPLEVYKVYANGEPDELVRGVDIIGTPITALTKIINAGEEISIFNGFCGAESGMVPVGAASPSLLIGEIEIQKKEISQASLPVLQPPVLSLRRSEP
jgi:TldD protein